jgi:hypothetical protein
MKCLVPRVYRVPAGDWLCSECCEATPVGKRPQSYYALSTAVWCLCAVAVAEVLPCWCVMAVIWGFTCIAWAWVVSVRLLVIGVV